MNNLAYYAEDARRKAYQDRILHYDAIVKFIDDLFFCKDLKLSAANKEKLKYINAHKRLSNKKLAEILCCHERTIKELRKAC